jgi:hypothetical protein
MGFSVLGAKTASPHQSDFSKCLLPQVAPDALEVAAHCAMSNRQGDPTGDSAQPARTAPSLDLTRRQIRTLCDGRVPLDVVLKRRVIPEHLNPSTEQLYKVSRPLFEATAATLGVKGAELLIIEEAERNAYAFEIRDHHWHIRRFVGITSGLINACDDDSLLRLVYGHELTHSAIDAENSVAQEAFADFNSMFKILNPLGLTYHVAKQLFHILSPLERRIQVYESSMKGRCSVSNLLHNSFEVHPDPLIRINIAMGAQRLHEHATGHDAHTHREGTLAGVVRDMQALLACPEVRTTDLQEIIYGRSDWRWGGICRLLSPTEVIRAADRVLELARQSRHLKLTGSSPPVYNDPTFMRGQIRRYQEELLRHHYDILAKHPISRQFKSHPGLGDKLHRIDFLQLHKSLKNPAWRDMHYGRAFYRHHAARQESELTRTLKTLREYFGNDTPRLQSLTCALATQINTVLVTNIDPQKTINALRPLFREIKRETGLVVQSIVNLPPEHRWHAQVQYACALASTLTGEPIAAWRNRAKRLLDVEPPQNNSVVLMHPLAFAPGPVRELAAKLFPEDSALWELCFDREPELNSLHQAVCAGVNLALQILRQNSRGIDQAFGAFFGTTTWKKAQDFDRLWGYGWEHNFSHITAAMDHFFHTPAKRPDPRTTAKCQHLVNRWNMQAELGVTLNPLELGRAFTSLDRWVYLEEEKLAARRVLEKCAPQALAYHHLSRCGLLRNDFDELRTDAKVKEDTRKWLAKSLANVGRGLSSRFQTIAEPSASPADALKQFKERFAHFEQLFRSLPQKNSSIEGKMKNWFANIASLLLDRYLTERPERADRQNELYAFIDFLERRGIREELRKDEILCSLRRASDELYQHRADNSVSAIQEINILRWKADHIGGREAKERDSLLARVTVLSGAVDPHKGLTSLTSVFSRIPGHDPEVRHHAVVQWARLAKSCVGIDDSSHQWLVRAHQKILRPARQLPPITRRSVLNEVMHELQTQEKASTVFNTFAPTREDLLRDGSILKALGPLGKLLVGATTQSQKEAILNWLRTPEESQRYGAARDHLLNSLDQGYFNRSTMTEEVHVVLLNAHREYHIWPLEIRASLVEVLLLRVTPNGSIPAAGKNYCSRLLAEAAGTYKDIVLKTFGVLIQAAPQHWQFFYWSVLPAIIPVKDQSGELDRDETLRSIAQGLMQFIYTLEPVGIRVNQLIHILPEADYIIRETFADAKRTPLRPERAEIIDGYAQKVPGAVRAQISHLGSVLGTGTYIVALEVQLCSGERAALLLFRDNVQPRARRGIRFLKSFARQAENSGENSLGVIAKATHRIVRLVERYLEAETNGEILAARLRTMNERYGNQYRIILGEVISTKVPKIRACGPEWILMDIVDGERLVDMPAGTARDRALIMGIVQQLQNLLDGVRVCLDRHSGNQTLKGSTLLHYDPGMLEPEKYTPDQAKGIREVILSLARLKTFSKLAEQAQDLIENAKGLDEATKDEVFAVCMHLGESWDMLTTEGRSAAQEHIRQVFHQKLTSGELIKAYGSLVTTRLRDALSKTVATILRRNFTQ